MYGNRACQSDHAKLNTTLEYTRTCMSLHRIKNAGYMAIVLTEPRAIYEL